MKKTIQSLYVLFGLLIPLFGTAQETNTNTEGQRLFNAIFESGVTWDTCGYSTENRPIVLKTFGAGADTIIIFGGFHGDEFAGVELVSKFADYLAQEKPALNAFAVIVPLVNPDGLLRGTRINVNKVDVNRNFPTENWKAGSRSPQTNPGPSPASEAESKVVIGLLEKYRPDRIVSVHSALRMVNFDGPAKSLADAMAQHNHYPVSSDIGYPTPGSFGTYAGVERKIPTVTLEMPSDTLGDAWEVNRDALLTAIRFKAMAK